MLLVGFAGALRRSEIVAIDTGIQRSDGYQYAEAALPLIRYLRTADDFDNPLLRLAAGG